MFSQIEQKTTDTSLEELLSAISPSLHPAPLKLDMLLEKSEMFHTKKRVSGPLPPGFRNSAVAGNLSFALN